MGEGPAAAPSPLSLSLRINSSLELASAAMAAIGRLLVEIVGEERGERFALACTEAVNNAILHGSNGDPEQVVGLAVSVDGHRVTASIEDQGQGGALAERMAALPVNPYEREGELPESGVGLWLIRQGADQVEYRRGPAGNALVLTLYLA